MDGTTVVTQRREPGRRASTLEISNHPSRIILLKQVVISISAVLSCTERMRCLHLLPAERQREVVTVRIEQIEDAGSQGLMASLSSVPPGPFEAPAMLEKGRNLAVAKGFSFPLSPNSLVWVGLHLLWGDGCPVMGPVPWLLLPPASLAPYQPCLGGASSVPSL